MNQKEFKKLKVGDIVVITVHGMNNGKKGVVREIAGRTVYLEPHKCVFEFSSSHRWRFNRKPGLYGYNYISLAMSSVLDDEEKRDQSFVIKFVGTEEQVEQFIREMQKSTKKIAPKAKVTITREK